MKVIIAGSRSITDQRIVNDAISQALAAGMVISEVFSGGAKGVDLLGERWARQKKVPVRRFIPFWNLHGKSAGILRNIEMAKHADALIAVWDGQSSGTGHMLKEAVRMGLLVHAFKLSFNPASMAGRIVSRMSHIDPAGSGSQPPDAERKRPAEKKHTGAETLSLNCAQALKPDSSAISTHGWRQPQDTASPLGYNRFPH
jgi:YspA, cpYpsA-related SLOG family